MTPQQIKALNIGEQINAYIREHRFQEILGNKKADCLRQDDQSALDNTPINTQNGANQHEPV